MEKAALRKRGRPTRFPGKPNQQRLTISLTPACRKRIAALATRMACSQSDVVEHSVWQVPEQPKTAPLTLVQKLPDEGVVHD